MPHPYFDISKPIVLGHRGAAGVAPENTLVAFERGLELGAQVIESDVHLTRDGVPVLIHDESVDRTTDGRGPVAERSLAELHELDAGVHFTPDEGASYPFRNQGLRIPALEKAFELFPAARFNLEIKGTEPKLVSAVAELVRSRDREELTLLTAGEDAVMANIRAELDRSGATPALGASLSDILEFIRAAQQAEAPASDSMALQIPAQFGGRPLITTELLEHCHAHGVQVHVWTINLESEIEALLDLGVDGIVTDFPGRMAKLVARRRGR
jgi:glycerophosphoryl diester phosphodiesterase